MLHRLLTGTATLSPALRSLLAGATALAVCLALGRAVIERLKALKIGERTELTPIENEELKKSIVAKSGTPTMGGVLILAGLLAGCLLWADPGSPVVWVTLGCALALAGLGAADDWTKLTAKQNGRRGLNARHKLIAQGLVGAGVGVWMLTSGLPYSAPVVVGPAALVAWAALVVATMSNSTNVTDGMDGLLAGLAAPAAVVMAVACGGEPGVVCGALAGACLGFLWFNRHPARVFMGDTGSMAIGGTLAAAALLARREPVLVLVGLVFLLEFGSSLLQIGYFKLTKGRRIFRVAPVHYSFQHRGFSEPAIVRGFYVFGMATALAAVACLWLWPQG